MSNKDQSKPTTYVVEPAKVIITVPPTPAPAPKKHMWQLFVAGGLASMIAEALTIPMDTVKVRMQIFQGQYKGAFQCMSQIAKTEGPLALYQGLSAGLWRQAVFASLRIGMFDVYMQYLESRRGGVSNITLLDRIWAGIITGGIAISIANPIDVIKVRFQAESRKAGAQGGKARYSGVFDAAHQIWKHEGMKGFYQSLVPNILRNSIMNAVELGSYSQIKQSILDTKVMKDGTALHFVSSAMAGFLAVLIGSPADVIKSVVMDGKVLPDGKKVPFNSVGEAIGSVYKKKGFTGFYQGFSANCQRLISWNIAMFMIREKINAWFRQYNARTH